MTEPLQHVFVDLGSARKTTSAGEALYLLLFKDDQTSMGWIYPLNSKCAVDVAAATMKLLDDVGDAVKCFLNGQRRGVHE